MLAERDYGFIFSDIVTEISFSQTKYRLYLNVLLLRTTFLYRVSYNALYLK